MMKPHPAVSSVSFITHVPSTIRVYIVDPTLTAMKLACAAVARARAMSVLLHPGGP